MPAALTDAPHFKDDDAARAFIEGIRWPEGPVCGHCGETSRRYATKRSGRYRCGNPECRKDYTVTTGTVMESSHIALHKWLLGFYLMSASKKGVSAHQLHRALGIGYKAAWFMAHRIREAMREGGLTPPEPLGGAEKTVEMDETYIGKQKGRPVRRGTGHKNCVLTLVERGGRARSFHVENASMTQVLPIVRKNIARETAVVTDEAPVYMRVGPEFASHDTVTHAKDEYVRYEGHRVIHTNTVEGYYSVFKRGMKGVYQHCAEHHLHRYLAEYDFRYNHRVRLGYNDTDRTNEAIRGAEGKRLTYR